MTNTPIQSATRTTLLASALGLTLGFALFAAPAMAQDYRGYDQASYQQDPENVEVTAPRFHTTIGERLNGPLEALSLSGSVPYDDLDLRSWEGARELRMRVRDEAHYVCGQLREAYPVRQASGTSCYKTAVQNGLVRADAAIGDARQHDDDDGY